MPLNLRTTVVALADITIAAPGRATYPPQRCGTLADGAALGNRACKMAARHGGFSRSRQAAQSRPSGGPHGQDAGSRFRCVSGSVPVSGRSRLRTGASGVNTAEVRGTVRPACADVDRALWRDSAMRAAVRQAGSNGNAEICLRRYGKVRARRANRSMARRS